MSRDDFMFTIGALILGLGLYTILNRTLAYAVSPEIATLRVPKISGATNLPMDLTGFVGSTPNTGKLQFHTNQSGAPGSLREEWESPQIGPNMAFDVRFVVGEATNDQFTLEYAGPAHHGPDPTRQGYKFRLGEDGKGSFLQKQNGEGKGAYGPKQGASAINLQVGHEYGARAVQQTITNAAGQRMGVHLEGWLQDITARGALKKISTYDDMEPGDLGVKPYYFLPNSRVGTRQDGRKNASIKFIKTFRQIPLSPIKR